MNQIIQVFGTTMPIFLLMGLGYFATRRGLFDQQMLKGLTAFCIYLALPALLISSISNQPFEELIVPEYLYIYGGASLAVFFLVYAAARIVFKESGSRASIWGLGGSFSNTLLMGMPIYSLMLESYVFVIPAAMMVLVETLLILPLSLILAESSGQSDKPWHKRIISSTLPLVRNPLLIGIALGSIVSIFSISLLDSANKVIDMLAVTVSGVALFTIGGMLVNVPKGVLARPLMVVMPAKLLIHPALIVALSISVGGISDVMIGIAIINGSIAMFGMYPIIAAKFNLGEEAAGILVLTTIFSFLSINIAVWFTKDYFIGVLS